MNDYNSIRHILAIESNGWKRNFFLDKNTYSLGRSSTNAIVIHHRVISRNHATFLKVTYQGEKGNNSFFWIIDGDLKGNRSTNGIYVNGKRHLSSQLQPGDVILLGGVEVRAKYDIFDIKSRTFYSATKSNNLKVETEENLDQEEDKSTSIATRELNKEPLREAFVKVINEIKDHHNFIYITANSQGQIREISKPAESIADLDDLKIEHPLFQDFNFALPQNHHKLLVRDFNLDDRSFTQYIYYSEKSDLITTYLLTRSQKQQLEIELRENEERYDNIIKQISEGILFVDFETREIVEVNQAYCQLSGYSEAEIIGLKLNDLVILEQNILSENLNSILTEKTSCIRESIHRHKDGSLTNVEVNISIVIYLGKKTLCLCVRNITERKKMEELLRYQTSHDIITNLPNYKFFTEQLFAYIANNKKTQKELCLILIKIDNFKEINYSLGDEISSKLLQFLAKKIKTYLAVGDVVARWIDNDLIILLPEINSEEQINSLVKHILAEVNKPLIIEEFSLYLTLSIGIAIYPHHGKNERKLLQNVNTALVKSREQSGSNYQFYEPNLSLPFLDNFNLKNSIYEAINNQTFYLKYEPEFNINTKNISTLHSYLRYQSDNEQLSNLSELELLEIAAEMGLSKAIFNWWLQTICEDYQMWLESQPEDVILPKVSLRILLSSLQDTNLVEQITNILEFTEINYDNLQLEIIYDDLVNNLGLAKQNLLRLSEEGINLCLSNFDLEKLINIGDSELPITSIKISGKIIHNLENNIYNKSLIRAIVELGKSLGVTVFAENIANHQIWEILSSLECVNMTGEVFTTPLLSEQIPDLLNSKIDVYSSGQWTVEV